MPARFDGSRSTEAGTGFRSRAAFAVAGVILVVVVLLIARESAPMFPVADEAVTELAVLDALQGAQMLGPYSRYPWHHPGPALFYLLAPFYGASGWRATGLAAGALTINVLAFALAVWALFRCGGAALALACAAALALFVARVPGVLISPWNAHVAAILAVAVMVFSAATAAGWPAALPFLIGLASVVVQTHIAALPLAALAVGIASAAMLVPSSSKVSKRTIALTAIVFVLVWIVPLVEQASPDGGNISRLWRFAVTPSTGAGWLAVLQAWADALFSTFRPSFGVPAGLLVTPSSPWIVGAAAAEILLLALVAIQARAAGRRMHMWMAVLLLTTSVVALWAVSRIPDGIHDHEVFWIAAAGALNAGVIFAWPLAQTSLDARRRSSAVVLAGAVAGLATVGSLELSRMVDRSHELSFNDRLIRNLTGAVDAEIARVRSGRTAIAIDQRVWPAAAGVILQLRKAGRVLAVDPDLAHMFSGTLAADGSEDLEVSFCGGPCHEQMAARPGNVIVWLADGVAVDALPQKR